jgi:hypothetical protein
MTHSPSRHAALFGGIAVTVALFGCSGGADGTEQEASSITTPLTRWQSTSLWPRGDVPVCWEGNPTLYTAEKQLVQREIVDSWGKQSSLIFPSDIGTMWPSCTPDAPGIHLTPGTANHVSVLGNQGGKALVSLDFRAAPSFPPELSGWCAGNRDVCIGWAAKREFGHALGFGDPEEATGDPQNCSPGSSHAGDTSWGPQFFPTVMGACMSTTSLNFAELDVAAAARVYGPERGVAIAHSAGRCIRPSTGQATPMDGIPAVLADQCWASDAPAMLEVTNTDRIRHTASGKCLQPIAHPPESTTLVYRSDCTSAISQFALLADGRIRHAATGLCVQPLGGKPTPAAGTELVLGTCDAPHVRFKPLIASPGPTNTLRITHRSGLSVRPRVESGAQNLGETRAILTADYTDHDYELTAAGSLRYFDTGTLQWLCMIPYTYDQPPTNNTRLGHTTTCDTPANAFEYTWYGSLRHVASGKCIHPYGGATNPASGTDLVLHDGCDISRLRFNNSARYR